MLKCSAVASFGGGGLKSLPVKDLKEVTIFFNSINFF